MLTYDPLVNLQHYPGIPMSRYGLNPYLEPLFRIVFAPSRQSLVCGQFWDGNTGGQWLPLYGHVGDKWVMEKWLSPYDFCKMSRDRWDREMQVLGPWPDRGEYELCHVFDACVPAAANLDKLIMWINEGKNRPYAEVRAACEKVYAQETKDTERMQEAAFKDALPAFGTVPLVGYGGKRGSKNGGLKLSANDLGLPVKSGSMTPTRSAVQV